ncbi:MAG TPA: geranylgeranyl reductase family protein [Longimicrobiales bacterium]|nr:geranylgeranyl reductase family protein [Longimicrobiales bacterium]
MRLHDVVIVGAGPAGAHTAYLLAERGLDVLILDKEDFPRDKVCGGGLSDKAVRLLGFDLSPIVQQRIAGAFLTWENRRTVVRDLDGPAGVTTLRRDFDRLLLDRAVSAGARFRPKEAFADLRQTGDVLEVTTSSGAHRARYVLGADGVFSRVRKRCFPDDLVSYSGAVEALVPATPSVLERFRHRVLFDFGGMPRGYGWIFPKRDHLNVGVFSAFGSASIREELRRFMGRYTSLRSAADVRHVGFCIPVRNNRERVQELNVWLVGDAAGFAESLFGEGIYFALRGATLAARALAETFEDPSSDLYSELVRRELWPDLKYAALQARLVFARPRVAFEGMVRNQRVNDLFSGLITGRVGHRDCFWRALRSVPLWPLAGRLAYASDLRL